MEKKLNGLEKSTSVGVDFFVGAFLAINIEGIHINIEDWRINNEAKRINIEEPTINIEANKVLNVFPIHDG